ncbi:EKC/KEOPS complex subunit LAGE3 [Pipistrellus kuhlii]|uniref:L antigen family member 3 n=1 Tax=Pipistrellus kuhlii TaxID=59472 RepID=A0A7J7S4V3_PIPKU|nr:EKC/KEOPS complex subunit LAGE3 [Pipistrellus kuhlii]KAF6283389.1 L antigen family member 3 [Pipistrellus kuhlii]
MHAAASDRARARVREGAGPAGDTRSSDPRVARAQHVSGSGGDAAILDRRPGNQHTFALSVPFPSPLEAEIARASLAPDVEPHGELVQKELAVDGSVLVVHWRAEDSRLLRTSIVNFLDQLSLVIRTMQRFGPPLPR